MVAHWLCNAVSGCLYAYKIATNDKSNCYTNTLKTCMSNPFSALQSCLVRGKRRITLGFAMVQSRSKTNFDGDHILVNSLAGLT